MAGKFQSGPNVYLSEIDVSTITNPVGTNIGVIVVKSDKGPTNQRVLINRDQELINNFGEPSESLGYGLYAGLEFLKASNQLYVLRSTSGVENYAHVGLSANTGVGYGSYRQILDTSPTVLFATTGYEDGNKPNDNYSINNNFSFNGEYFVVAANGPGTYGNDLAISVVTCASPVSAGFDWLNRYDSNPLTDVSPTWQKVFRINVYQKATNSLGFNSVSGSPIETFYVSRQQISDDNGNNLFIEKVINGISKYIYVKNNSSVSDTSYPSPSGLLPLLSGTNNSTVPQSSIQSSWSLIQDKEKSSVNILICTECGDKNSTQYATQQVVGNIAASRQDCIALCQIDGTSATVTNATTIANNAGYGYNNPSYVSLYAGWELIYDKFNDRNIYVPEVIYGASLMARVENPWVAPAGINRGSISSLGQNVIWNGAQIAIFDDAHINVSKFIRGQGGNFMWTQATALRKNSALAAINVRRLLLFVEGTVMNSLLPFMYENNNSKTRLRIKSILDNFLSSVASAGGFNTDSDRGFLVQCDSVNNTALVIDSEQLVVNVFCKPSRAIKYISLNMIVTATGISFEELAQ